MPGGWGWDNRTTTPSAKLPVGHTRPGLFRPCIVLRPGLTDPELMREILHDVFRQGFPLWRERYVVQPEGMARYSEEL